MAELQDSSKPLIPYVLACITRVGPSGKEVLLLYRSNTNFPTDCYDMVGGKVDQDESPSQAVVREVYEEVGLLINPVDAHLSRILYFQEHTRLRVAFAFSIEKWEGDVINKEPEKHSHVGWFPLNDLPPIPVHRHLRVIESLKKGIFFEEDGF